MRDFGAWALGNKKLIHFLIVVLVVGGLFAYKNMSKLEDPEIQVKDAVVLTLYPGASASQVELQVTDLLEKSIRSMSNVEKVKSRSSNDMSVIKVKLSTLVHEGKVDQCWDILRRKVSDVQKDLPEGASSSVVMDDFGDVFGLFYAMTFDNYSYDAASKYADLIKKEILKVNGVSKVDIYGDRKKCINIKLYENRLANLGVSPAEIISTIKGQNKTVYSGYYESGDARIRVSVGDKYKTVENIGSLILQGHEDDQLRLSDIAEITEDYETPVRSEFRYDKKQALGIAVSAKDGTDITKVGKDVKNLLDKMEKQRLPAGIELHKVFIQSDRVNAALNSFVINLLESIIIVVVLLMITMGLRSGIILGINLIIIILGSILILYAFDGTLQRVSLASFVLAMGMLVDNAIVIIDGIQVDMRRGVPRKEALTGIGKKTAMPLLGATLIAILAFLPIFMSPDNSGVYVRDLFIVLAVSLLLSWVMALTVVPVHADMIMKVKNKGNSDDQYSGKYYDILKRALTWVLNHRMISIGSCIALVLISLFCYRFVKHGFFPDMDYDQLYLEYKIPDGYNSTRVKADLDKMEDYLLSRKEITHVSTSIGATPFRYNLVRIIENSSLSYGEIIVDYTSPKALVASMEEIQAYLNDNFPDAVVRLKRYNLMSAEYPIEVQFSGPDPAVLRKLTDEAIEIMKKSPDIDMTTTDWKPEFPVLKVKYNQPIARDLGLSRQDVGLSILAADEGFPVGEFYDGIRSEAINIKCVDLNGNPLTSIKNAPVFTMLPSLRSIDKNTLQGLITGSVSGEDVLASSLKTIPLSQVADSITVEWEEPLVIRRNGERAMKAQCSVVQGMGVENARETIADEIDNIKLPEGYSMRWAGEKDLSQDSMYYLFMFYPVAIVLMIMILIMLFKDYRKPLILILCLPMLFIGLVFGILLSGKTFGFVAIVATLGLVGMLTKSGIVLMDEISLQISSGVEPYKALINSASVRFRPVMLASLTTILGMIPLLDDSLFGPAAIVIIGGLLIGTIIILLLIPLLYAVIFRVKNK